MRPELLIKQQPSTIDRPERMGDIIHIHGQHMSLNDAELKGMVKVERDKNGYPKTNGQGVIRYTKISAH